jgi:flagellin-like protein
MAKNMLKSKKAISPILATLLLIVIAVAAIVVTYAWIMTYMTSAGHQAGVMMSIENVNFFSEGDEKKVNVTVSNAGTSNTNIARIYMGTSEANLAKVWEGTKPLDAKTAVTITITYDWQSRTRYYFKAVSDSANEAPYSIESP